MLYKDALRDGISLLKETSETPRLDAEILLAHIRSLPRWKLPLDDEKKIPEKEWHDFMGLCERRKQREPIAYILGYWEFMGAKFMVSSSVLIPRPETELLVEKAIELAGQMSGPLTVIDVGTGSGCIGVSFALHAQKFQRRVEQIILSDISAEALEVASKNAAKVSTPEIKLIRSDLLSAFRSGSADLILSNPPYVAADEYESLSPDVREFEPELALVARHEDLFFPRLFAQAYEKLREGGAFLLETNPIWAARQREQLAEAGFRMVDSMSDYASLPRFLIATKPG